MNDAFGRPDSVLVLGGTSDIARSLLKILIADGCKKVVLAGRNADGLAEVATEAKEAGAEFVASIAFDANDVEQAPAVVDSGFSAVDRVDLVVIAVGVLYDDEADERDPARVASCITVNFTWPATALARVAHHLREQGSGRVVVLSSVAGVRVRRSNFLYGSAKGGLDAFARNLHLTLSGSGAGVLVVRPGFVRSKMTEGRKAAPLATTPEAVAKDIVRGLEGRAEVVWSPAPLRLLFLVLRLLPEVIWRRLPM